MPDAFDILGLPPRFDLSAAEVRAAYLARVGGSGGVGGVHSDGETLQSAFAVEFRDEIVTGDTDASALNAAKTALSDAETRANLLLARFGGPSKEVNRDLPDGFLMTMMEAREELEAASSKRDAAGVERWREWAERERDGHIARVGEMFREHGRGDGKGAGVRLTAVRRELNAWRYIERMLEQIGAL